MYVDNETRSEERLKTATEIFIALLSLDMSAKVAIKRAVEYTDWLMAELGDA